MIGGVYIKVDGRGVILMMGIGSVMLGEGVVVDNSIDQLFTGI